MLLIVDKVLDADRLAEVSHLLAEGRFVDGRLSAGTAARRVKLNQELRDDDARLERLNRIVMGALLQHPGFRNGAFPLRVAAPFYARYQPGMRYGDHVDDPVMGPPGAQYRSDVSTTVFLNSPADYDGGDLVIRTEFGDRTVKLPAGDAVVYPSSSLHHVAEVTRGERLVAVTWTQSMIRDPGRRALLHELNLARESLLAQAPDAPAARQVDHSYVNLFRMWAEL